MDPDLRPVRDVENLFPSISPHQGFFLYLFIFSLLVLPTWD